MAKFQVKMYVTYKDGILDPAGMTTAAALQSLGYTNTANVSIGKYITLSIDASDKAKAETQVKEMANKLLTNPIIEKYTVAIEAA